MILAIESSCDDSSISITEIETKKLIYHKKISQELEHSVYGGVVPELASRLHAEALPKILEECTPYFADLKAIAVTTAPGLNVTLVEGVTMAKALSISLGIPLIAVNHLKGHIYSLFIEKEAKIFTSFFEVNKILHKYVIHQSMKFSTTYEDILFVVEVTRDDDYREIPTNQLGDDERELIAANEIAIYQVMIQAGEGDDQTTHYISSVLFSANEEEISEELDGYLIEGGVLDEILQKRKPD